jgi:hypothetical protein
MAGGYGAHVTVPTLRAAAGLGGRALARSGWLVAAGLLVAAARGVLALPAAAVATSLLGGAALLALSMAPFSPGAPVAGALAAATSPRFVALVGGLWLAGALLGGALRVAWLGGALGTLGGHLAGEARPPPRFASCVAYAFPRVLATAVLAWLAQIAGAGFALALVVASARITFAAAGTGAPVLLAAAVAGALTLAVLVPFVLSVVADAAVARAALRGEGPARALAGAGARVLRRPGAFLLGAMLFGAGGSASALAVRSTGAAFTGLAAGAPPAVALGPELMLAVAGAAVAVAVELWWLGTAAVLACHEG